MVKPMHIGFIFPNKDRRYKTVHLGIGYLAAYARKKHPDLHFSVLDTRVATQRETRAFFASSFDLIGITVYSPVYREVGRIFDRCRKSFPEVPLCLGGPYVTTIMEEIFEQTPADYAIYGEGEETFSELIALLKGVGDLPSISGLMYKDSGGKIIRNPVRAHIPELDALPMPAWDIFPMDRYPLHRMVTSRGCPYACAWCNSSSLWRTTYRMRSPEKCIEEIEYLLEHYGKKIFVFGDNSFNIDLKRVDRFCDLLLEKNLRILWSVSLRADRMNPELARKMKEAGCYNAAIGVESANNGILARIGKGTVIEKITEGIGYLKDAGIEVLAQFVIGNPGDTLDTVKESVAWARNSRCDFVNFYTVLPFKGTPQWDYVHTYGRFYKEKIHEFHTVEPRIVFDTPEFPYQDRLEAIRLVKKAGYYSNKDKKAWLFDLAKETSRSIQKLLPAGAGEKVYLMLKSIYRFRLVKKHNI